MKRDYIKGITLIALVITIIVLLILAGITVATLTGDDGILKKAILAKEETMVKEYEEQLRLIWEGVKLENRDHFIPQEELLVLGKKEIEKNDNFKGSIVEIKIEELILEIKTKEGYIFYIQDHQIVYIRKDGEPLKDIEVSLTASRPENKKITFTASLTQAGGRQVEYIIYINGEEQQRKTTYQTTFSFEKETTFDETVEAYVEVKYEADKTSYSNKISVIDYTINQLEEIITFRNKVNAGESYEGKTIELVNDIDLLGTETNQWVPIGSESNNFKGTFEGNHYKIKNLYINNRGIEFQALFGHSRGNIQNLELSGTVISNEAKAAILCSTNYGKISNVTTNGTLQVWAYSGGCVGGNFGTIESCVNNADVSILSTTGYYGRNIGGITGVNHDGSKVEKCINYGEIKGNHGVGGIVGEGSDNEINLCINKGKIIGLSADPKYNSIYVGGIIGGDSYKSRGIIRNCINMGQVESTYSGSVCGGIVAYVAGTTAGNSLIENCYNVGMVSGTNKGGIVAREGFSSSSMGVSEVKNNYWLDTCGVTYGRGSMNNNEQAEVKTSQELKQLANGLGEEYTSDIQNENGTWKYNEGYPVLKWQLENDKTLT